MSQHGPNRYGNKDAGYFDNPRFDLLEMLPQQGGLRLLELGAGSGATLREAKRRGLAAYTAALDLVAPSPGRPTIDDFQVGDIEHMELKLPGGDFDVVIAGDVLEHLVDPWAMVRRLEGVLKPGGLFLASIPNFRNFRALAPILFGGDFRYERAGLLDRTHLRFFCRRNIEDLFEHSGFQIEAIEENMGGHGLRNKLLDSITLGFFHDFFVFQYRVCARKPAARA